MKEKWICFTFIKLIEEDDRIYCINRLLELFEEEAVRVVSNMPKWKPGVRNGIPMKVEYELPINFRIDYHGNVAG